MTPTDFTSPHRFWAPWRLSYITEAVSKPATTGCIFCDRVSEQSDDDALVVWRGREVFVILNKFPYVRAHAMVCPLRHVDRWSNLTLLERRALLHATRRTESALRDLVHPERVFVGANIGAAAGAGVPGHLHVHLVPEVAADAPRTLPSPEQTDPPAPLDSLARDLRKALA